MTSFWVKHGLRVHQSKARQIKTLQHATTVERKHTLFYWTFYLSLYVQTWNKSSSSDSLWSHKFSKPSIISDSTQHWKIQHYNCASLTWWICWQNKAVHLKYHSIIFSQKVEIPSLFSSRACIYSPSGFSSQQCCLFTKLNSEIHWFLSNWPLLWMTLSNSPSNFPWCWWWFINNLIILH